MSDSEKENKDLDGMEEEDLLDDKKVGEEEDLTGNGAVKKKILKKGSGWEKPETGAEITCHYVGKLLDGTIFDSSRERGQEFKFFLGKGQVIKGWDEGFKKMLKGEQALLTIQPDYAYGAAGSPPKIPPNSTLQFEVELISWVSEEDISSEKDKSILKKIIKEGEGYQKPKEDEKVTVNYTLRLEDGRQVEEKHGFSFTLGAEEVLESFDHAVSKLKKGERALITILPQRAYGNRGDSERNIPPNAVLKYEVELVDWEKEPESWKMSNQDKIAAALKAKNEGNELFKLGKLKRAHKKYKKALDFIQYDSGFSEEEKERSKQVKLPLHLNQAQVHLKEKEYSKVLEDCKKVFEIDKNNVKAFYRKGLAEVGLDRWEDALKDFDKAKELGGNDEVMVKEVDREVLKLKKKMAEHSVKEKQVYSKMLAGI